jgi:hypothetical protein
MRARDVVTIAITTIWGLTTLVAALTNQATVVAVITPVMLVVAGFYYGAKRNGA